MTSYSTMKACTFPNCKRAGLEILSQVEQLALTWDDVQTTHIAGFISFHPRCRDHNWCFYCKDWTTDNYRLCNHCAADRAVRYGKNPSRTRLPEFYARPIMKFMNLTRDEVDLICRFLPKIDQVMLAVSCYATFRPSPKFMTQARVLDRWNQFVWFLDHNCVAATDCQLNFDFIFEHRDLCLIRQYHTMIKPYTKTNLVGHLKISNLGLELGDTDFFKWAVTENKSMRFDMDNAMAHIIKADDTDLLEWLFKNSTSYCVRKSDLERIVKMRMVALCKITRSYSCRVKGKELVFDLLEAGDWDSIVFLKDCDFIFPLVSMAIEIMASERTDFYPPFLAKGLELGDPPTGYDLMKAFDLGKLELANWLIPQIDFQQRQFLVMAIVKGNLETVKLLHKSGVRIDNDMMIAMVTSDKLEMLQWLRSEGVEIPVSAYVVAIQYNKVEIIKWFESIYADDELSAEDRSKVQTARNKTAAAGNFFRSLGRK